MGFLLKNIRFYILFTLGLLITEAITAYIWFIVLAGLGGGLLSPPDPDPSQFKLFLKSLGDWLWWGGLSVPVPFFFRISWKKVGLKDTIKLFVIYSLLVFLFTVGQLVGMEKAWIVLVLMLVLPPTMIILFDRYK